MTVPSIRKALWSKGKQRGLGQDGRGVQMSSGPFGQPFGSDDEEESVSVRGGGEAFRDLDQSSRAATKILQLPPFEAVYIEPMLLQLKSEPVGGIYCLRVIDVLQPDIPVETGGTVHFRWTGSQAQINSIDGMSPTGRTYRFNFLVVG